MLHLIGQAMLIADRMERRYDSDAAPQESVFTETAHRRERGWTGLWLALPGFGR